MTAWQLGVKFKGILISRVGNPNHYLSVQNTTFVNKSMSFIILKLSTVLFAARLLANRRKSLKKSFKHGRQSF